MHQSPSSRLCLAFAGLSVSLFLPSVHPAHGEEAPKTDGVGIVWFIGTVQHGDRGQAVFDMGDAHALDNGEAVAVFRPLDMHFRPLGGVSIQESFASWSIPARTSPIDLKKGDIFIYARTLDQLGTGNAFREGFLRQQIVKTGTRNSYSTVMQQAEADALQTYIARQPKWARDHKHVAGVIHSASATHIEKKHVQALLKQVMHLQVFKALEVPVAASMGDEWESVIMLLLPVEPLMMDPPKIVTTDDGTVAADASAAEVSTATAAQNTDRFVDSCRRTVERMMFVRAVEERRLAVVLCVALESIDWKAVNNRPPANERQWFMLQIQKSQFPSLAEDVQFLDDVQRVMTEVRQELMNAS